MKNSITLPASRPANAVPSMTAKKFPESLANLKRSHYFCGALHLGLASKLAEHSGHFLCSCRHTHTVPTPVRKVNASAASPRCNATGKRNRFIFNSAM